MALKTLCFITLMVAAASLHGVSAFFSVRKALALAPGPVPDEDFGFIPMNRTDPKVIELAKYAIDQYNSLNKSNLVFMGVYEAVYTESVNGTNYELVVAATDEKQELNTYEVHILVEKDDKKVIVFRPDE